MIISNTPHHISVSEMAPHIHDFKPGENKVEKLVSWLENWIRFALDNRKIKPYDFLPKKGDLAFHIGVSLGTIQTVFRRIEDKGLIESKQKIGTYISSQKNKVSKLTSKRELATELVKRYVFDNNYRIGDKIASSRQLANYTGLSNTTLRQAIIKLCEEGILKKEKNSYILITKDFEIINIETKTLVEKTAERIFSYIQNNCSSGDKLPTNSEFVKLLKVSSKTVHDAFKLLSKEGIIYSRRGRYGTIVLGEENIHSEIYNYEKIEYKIRCYISENCKIGDKLTSIKKLAKTYSTSEKTIKKALGILFEDGYVTFVRGRYGGTFVTDIPQTSNEAYKWLALSSNYITDSSN